MSKGLRINRRFTVAGTDPYSQFEWSRRDSKITNPDGSVVFEMNDAEIPAQWSQVASDIMVSKYFRKAGVPQFADEGNQIFDDDGEPVLGPERSAKQVFSRLAGTWRHWGEKGGYFASAEDAEAFEDELKYMLAAQMAAPNSPQWFNTGLNWAYGLTGPAQGFWYVDDETGELTESADSYSRPAPHACFINKVEDDLVNPGGIMDLWMREARIFKFGSGAGSNFSAIRAEGELLSGGGKSSGVMSFLKIGDRAAGAIKSGGTTRRAAKMVILDVDHPDIEAFIDWKKIEEEKAKVLIEHGGYPADFNGEAYATVSGQNSNNSVRVTNEFIKAVEDDADWNLINRTDGKVRKTVKARDLWNRIAEAAWACADPGLQFDTIVNEWHTSPAGGRIRATNPCAEYNFLDNTACNLASINLVKFLDQDTGEFDTEAYRYAVRLWTIVLEISVAMAHFPSPEIAEGSYDYRTLGLGYANLGSMLMRLGVSYDSNEGRAIAGALTAILTGYAYATSAEMAGVVGPFPRFAENREAMLRVIRNHRRAAYNADASEYEDLSHNVVGVDPDLCPPSLLDAAKSSWDLALQLGEEHGFRNAQATVLAPTGCLVGGSLVPTERGLVRLESLGNPDGSQCQDLDIQVSTDEGARTAQQFYVNGVEPVVAVDTHCGYRIQGTPTHRIKVVDGEGNWVWRRFGEIAKDELVPLQMNQLVGEPQTVHLPPLGEMHWTGDFSPRVPRTMTPDLAEFVGYFMGDGSLHAKGIRLTVAAEDF
ncbi:MAG TPA: adenosylcobalamin-dependent ribonucleoside-diphosphate reductase, partial [Acidimicrobiia bacterium]|nr:adenosylcobalamin-dependent ribonucleoside-diphosphate reductase [Acidimicrobiia bacterium]